MVKNWKFIDALAERLRTAHFDGLGCGTHGVNACVHCFGPSPMSATEIAEEVDRFLREQSSNKFKLGDKVYKPEGYKFPGTVVSVFEKTTGEVRLVVEDDRGLLHIFNESQLDFRTD